jgi:hypothetical protein
MLCNYHQPVPPRHSALSVLFALGIAVAYFICSPSPCAAETKKAATAAAADAGVVATAPEPIVMESDVYFSWKLNGAADTDAVRQFFTRVSQTGFDHAFVKSSFEAALANAKGEAIAACKREHEDLSGCFERRLREHEPVRRSSDFEGKRMFRDALKAECEQRRGACLGVSVTPAKRAETKADPAAGAASHPATAAPGKKEAVEKAKAAESKNAPAAKAPSKPTTAPDEHAPEEEGDPSADGSEQKRDPRIRAPFGLQ